MTQQEILNSSFTKTEKAKRLFTMGLTRKQVADLLMNGNTGFAYNVWKKWNEEQASQIIQLPFEFAFTRTFGVEIEYYGATRNQLITELQRQGVNVHSEGYTHTTTTHWKIVSDGSVRGEYGAELVSPVLRGIEGIEQLKKVCIALKRAGAKVNKTCGLHVHLGANDLILDHIKTLYKNYINLESEIDSIMPESRRGNNNNFCKKVISICRTREEAVRAIGSVSTIDGFKRLYNDRYVKLNFQAYQRQGTIEFRHHSGALKFSKIKNWIMLCARMIEFAKQNRTATQLNQITNEYLNEYIEDRKLDLSA